MFLLFLVLFVVCWDGLLCFVCLVCSNFVDLLILMCAVFVFFVFGLFFLLLVDVFVGVFVVGLVVCVV